MNATLFACCEVVKLYYALLKDNSRQNKREIDLRLNLCWAHARRKFYEARTAQPELAHVALAYVARLYRIERDAKMLIPPEGFSDDAAWRSWHEQRKQLRNEASLPVLVELHAWLRKTQTSVLPKSPIGKALQYVLPRWDGLTRYCEDGSLSIDNNLSERMIRPVAIGRKNYLFMGSDRGGKSAAVLYSLIATAKANGVEPFEFVRSRLAQLSASPAGDPDSLLPG